MVGTTTSDASQSTGSSGAQKGRRGRPRRGGTARQTDRSDSEGISMNDVPVETNGVVSVCDIELLTEEDRAIPDSKLASYNIEEEFVGFGVGMPACAERLSSPSSSGAAAQGGGAAGIRLCYSGLWRRLPQGIPVRELAMSRCHIAVLLNNGHVYVTLNEMNESLAGGLENSLHRAAPGGSQQQERPESGNEQRNSINSSNTLLLGTSISQGAWLNVKELDDKNIRGLRITSLAAEETACCYAEHHRLGARSFVLACLASDGKVWIVEHGSSSQGGGFSGVRHMDLTELNPRRAEGGQSESDFCRAVDITLSEMVPVDRRRRRGRGEQEEEQEEGLLLEDPPSFPFRYGVAVTSLLADGQSNSVILKRSAEIGHRDRMEVLDLPVICKKVFCGPNTDFGLILLQNGLLWSWDRRQGGRDSSRGDEGEDSGGGPRTPIRRRRRSPGHSSEESSAASGVSLRVLKGSLSGRKVIDFSSLNGEFIALTQDGVVHEWNDPDRMRVFKRPLIKEPLILTPKTHHLVMKRALSNGRYWSFDAILSRRVQNCLVHHQAEEEERGEDDDLKEMMEREIESMYSPDNKIIGAWLLEGVTLILYRNGALKALYNYLGRDGYDTKVGFISEEDELCWSRHGSSVSSCILLSSTLGRCIPANPIALVGLLSNFGRSKSLPDKQKQLIIQRSLVKLSLREKPVYRILACYNSIVFGILRPNPKWRPGRSHGSKTAQASKCQSKSDLPSQDKRGPSAEEMNLSATVNLNNVKEAILPREGKEDRPDPEAAASPSKSRGGPGCKRPSLHGRSCGSLGAAVATAAAAAPPPTNDSSLPSASCDSPPSLALEESGRTRAKPRTKEGGASARCRTSREEDAAPPADNRRQGPKLDLLSASLPPPSSNKRSSLSSQKSHNTTPKTQARTRKRERKSLSKTENKENSNDQNLLHHSGKEEEEEEDDSTRETKKLSLAEYEVEQILSIREKPLTKQKEYLIKWKVPGHPVQPTWEPEENLNGCEELLQEFLKSIKTSRSGRLLLPCTAALNKIV